MTVTEPRPKLDRPIYLDAGPLAARPLTGIGRYTARLALTLARREKLRYFDLTGELVLENNLESSDDQDLADWASKVSRSPRKAFVPEHNAAAIYTCLMPAHRRFPTEIAILHDLTPLILPDTHLRQTINDFQKLYAKMLRRADFAIADSQSTRSDASWLCDFPQEHIHVAHPGASLCVQGHLHKAPEPRQANVGLMVATLEPRKNARFLVDWFAESDAVPDGSELLWVGANGWKMSKSSLGRKRLSRGRSIRFLGFVDDRALCQLYQRASWMVYPSLYEGFGFPVLDALRHGLPVLCAGNSSLIEFAGPGIAFFDPLDRSTLDRKFPELLEGRFGAPPASERLDQRFSWNGLVDRLLDTLTIHQSIPEAQRGTRAA